LQKAFDGSRRSLLQFCSHHRLRDAEDDEKHDSSHNANNSAKASLAHVETSKREAYQKQKHLVQCEYRILAALSSFSAKGNSKAETEAEQKLSHVEDPARSLQFLDLAEFLKVLHTQRECQDTKAAMQLVDMSRPGSNAIRTVLRELSRDMRPQLVEFRTARTTQLSRCTSAFAKLLQIARSLNFFEATLKILRGGDHGHDAPECNVCLEPMDITNAAMLPCAHAFHMKCIGGLLANSHACPTCRADFGHRDVMPLNVSGINTGVSQKEIEQFGSKLAVIVKTLGDIQKKEPKSKAIVFVQWKQLENLVSEAFHALGIPHIRLQGTAVSRSRAIASFQNDREPRVLLQSLENSASGANITRASHVMLVHPMDAISHDRAVAYEMQALGRVRRCGQKARPVHLYRFVTRGTVEEDISKEHQVGVSAGLNIASSGAGI